MPQRPYLHKYGLFYVSFLRLPPLESRLSGHPLLRWRSEIVRTFSFPIPPPPSAVSAPSICPPSSPLPPSALRGGAEGRKEGDGKKKFATGGTTNDVGDVERALERQMEPPSSSPSSKAASSSQLDPPSLCNLGPNYPPTTQSAAINAKYPSFPFYLWRPRPPPRRSESKPSHLPPLCIILTT